MGCIEVFESLTDMMVRIEDHLTYLAMYAASSQSSEEVQKVRLMNVLQYLYSFIPNGYIVQALVEAYCDLPDFYVKVRKLLTRTPSCKWTKS